MSRCLLDLLVHVLYGPCRTPTYVGYLYPEGGLNHGSNGAPKEKRSHNEADGGRARQDDRPRDRGKDDEEVYHDGDEGRLHGRLHSQGHQDRL
jgi:hypothetical protein